MKPTFFIILTTLCLCLPASAQTTTSQLIGKVIDGKNNAVPHLELIPSNGDATKTDKNGNFTIKLYVGAGLSTTVRVGGNWAVIFPFGGKFTTQSLNDFALQTITVLPKRSPEFLAQDQLVLVGREVLRRRGILINTLRKENKQIVTENETKTRALEEANKLIARLQTDLAESEVIREYAEQTGHSFETIAAALERWSITQYKNYPEKDEAVRRSVQGDLEGAAPIALQAMKKQLKQADLIDEENDRSNAVKTKILSDALLSAQIAADAPQAKGDFASALAIYSEIDAKISSHPNFKEVLRPEWAKLRVFLIIAKAGLAGGLTSSNRARLFSEALGHCQEAITIYKQETDPAEWGTVQFLWAGILLQMASDVRGEKQKQTFTEAAGRLESVLKLNPSIKAGQDCQLVCWDAIKLFTALLTTATGALLGGEQGSRLLKEGSSALEKSLSTVRLDSTPRSLAIRYFFIGISQLALSYMLPGENDIAHLRVAKENFEKALDGKDAVVGNNRYSAMQMLADTWRELGQRTTGKESVENLKTALSHYERLWSYCDASAPKNRCGSLAESISFGILNLVLRGETTLAQDASRRLIAALEGRLKLFPADSASDNKQILQIALGKAYLEFGELVEGEEGAAKIWAGIESLERALSLLPKDDVHERASIQLKMLSSLLLLGRRVGMEKVVAKLNDVILNFETLVKDRAQWQAPALAVSAEITLGGYLRSFGVALGGEEGRRKFESAISHIQTALNRLSPDFDSDNWTHGNATLGDCLLMLAATLPETQRRPKLDEAVTAYKRALTVLTPAATSDWAHVRSQLAETEFHLALPLDSDEGRRQVQAALQMLVDTANAIDRKSYPIEWGMIQALLGRLRATSAPRQQTREKVLAELEGAIKSFEDALTVTYSGILAGIWAQMEIDYGSALSLLADNVGGEEGKQHRTGAIKAFNVALAVPALKASAIPRALAQVKLAHSLSTLGRWEGGPAGLEKLNDAAKNFDEALLILPRDKNWANAQLELGRARYDLAQAGGPDQVTNVGAAIRAYELALPLLSSRDSQGEWADANIHYGDALLMSGWLSMGPDRVGAWNRAVSAYNDALKIFKSSSHAEAWAFANLGLGNTLFSIGITRSPDKDDNFKRAIQSFQKSISVFNSPGFAEPLTDARLGLGDTYFQLKQADAAAKAYEDVLAVDGNNQRALRGLANVNHELTYNYSEALRLQEKLREIDPQNLDDQAGLAEAYFTAGRFSECEQLLIKLTQSDLDRNAKVAMRTIRILNTLALDRKAQVPEQIDFLISEVEVQSADFHLDWWFDGTQHFISQQKSLSVRQKWFSLLFRALESDNRDSTAARLRQAKANYEQ